MPNNKKAWHICQLAGKHPDNYCKYVFAYEFCINVFKNSKYGNKYAGILYQYKYLRYFEALPKDMWQFYIHHSLPCHLFILPTIQNISLTPFFCFQNDHLGVFMHTFL
jgi:hypothetical protein